MLLETKWQTDTRLAAQTPLPNPVTVCTMAQMKSCSTIALDTFLICLFPAQQILLVRCSAHYPCNHLRVGTAGISVQVCIGACSCKYFHVVVSNVCGVALCLGFSCAVSTVGSLASLPLLKPKQFSFKDVIQIISVQGKRG
jgi:hypothetical protein